MVRVGKTDVAVLLCPASVYTSISKWLPLNPSNALINRLIHRLWLFGFLRMFVCVCVSKQQFQPITVNCQGSQSLVINFNYTEKCLATEFGVFIGNQPGRTSFMSCLSQEDSFAGQSTSIIQNFCSASNFQILSGVPAPQFTCTSHSIAFTKGEAGCLVNEYSVMVDSVLFLCVPDIDGLAVIISQVVLTICNNHIYSIKVINN